MPEPHPADALGSVIFDVDGVVVASPHEKAWRAALEGFTDPAGLTTEVYQAEVAGKPRFAGARAALEALGVADAERIAPIYADRKQKMIEALIAARDFTAFPDAVRFIQALRARGFRLAVASSSRNANQMMQMIPIDTGGTLLDLFDANVCGRDLRRGKPDPEIFLLAASELGASPAGCVVVEDAPSGIEAAKTGGMVALGVARLGDEALLQAAGADLVVTSLDEVAVDALMIGLLYRR
jgi:HAD superfamily hydrolase (TIGR01509 family)